MKKKYLLNSLIIIFAAALACVAVTLLSSCAEEVNEYSLVYISSEGGRVYGDLNQTVTEGADGTEVVAIPDEGYYFSGWSDGINTKARTDGSVSENITVTAEFAPREVFLVKYTASEGGSVLGIANQKIYSGDDANTVVAKTSNGYRFIGWSDGVKTKERTDLSVSADISVEAQFEEIKVNFYSEGNLVRVKTLAQLNETNISDLKGYKSFSNFVKWNFGKDSGVVCDVADAAAVLKSQYQLFGITDKEDITLVAEYEPSFGGTVPENSKTIAHALGGMEDSNYLNSKEAFLYHYEKGQRFFEADLSLTFDDRIVVSHFLNSNATYEEFKSTATESYTPLDLFEFLTLISQYPDVSVDLDILSVYFGHYDLPDDNFNVFYRQFDETLKGVDPSGTLYDRLILEILPNENTQMFSLAKQYCSFSNFLYAEYYESTSPITDENVAAISGWCRDNGVKYLSIGGHVKPEWIEVMHDYGISVFVFTINGYSDVYKYLDMGADCVFTDYSFI